MKTFSVEMKEMIKNSTDLKNTPEDPKAQPNTATGSPQSPDGKRPSVPSFSLDEGQQEQSQYLYERRMSAQRLWARQMSVVSNNGAPVHKHIIHADSLWKSIWDWMMIGFVMYNSVQIPWEFSFQTKTTIFLKVFNYSVDFLFLIDIFFSFRTSYTGLKGEEIFEPKMIRRRYLTTWFPIDFIAVFPFDLIASFINNNANLRLLHLTKIPRLLRLGRLMKKLDQLAAANYFRIVKLMMGFALIAHWIACLWYFIGRLQDSGSIWTGEIWLVQDGLCQTIKGDGDGETPLEEVGMPNTVDGVLNCISKTRDSHDPWRVSGSELEFVTNIFNETVAVTPDAGGMTKYIAAVYWALTTLTTIGYGDISPSTNMERIFTIVVMLFGAVLYATIFGNVAVLIQSFNASNARYQQKMDTLKEFAEYHGITDHLYKRMVQYVDKQYDLTQGFYVKNILDEFPKSVQGEIITSMYTQLVDCLELRSPYICTNPSFLRALMLRFEPQVYMKGDFIIKKGDYGSEMYFIDKGVVEIIDRPTARSENIPGIFLGPGEHFGEIALMKGARTIASAFAYTQCELMTLKRSDYQSLARQFPEDISRIRAFAESRIRLDIEDQNMQFETQRKSGSDSSKSGKDTDTVDLVQIFAAQALGQKSTGTQTDQSMLFAPAGGDSAHNAPQDDSTISMPSLLYSLSSYQVALEENSALIASMASMIESLPRQSVESEDREQQQQQQQQQQPKQ